MNGVQDGVATATPTPVQYECGTCIAEGWCFQECPIARVLQGPQLALPAATGQPAACCGGVA